MQNQRSVSALLVYFIPIIGLIVFLKKCKRKKDDYNAQLNLFWLEYYHLNAAILLAAIFKSYFLNRS